MLLGNRFIFFLSIFLSFFHFLFYFFLNCHFIPVYSQYSFSCVLPVWRVNKKENINKKKKREHSELLLAARSDAAYRECDGDSEPSLPNFNIM